MTIFYATAKDECGHVVTLETEATTKGDAWEYFDEQYPDCRIYNVLTLEEIDAEADDRYQRLAAEEY